MANISTQGFGHIILTVNEDCSPNNISSKQNCIYNRSHDMAGERFKLSKLCKSPWLRWYNYVKPVWGSKNWWLTPNHRPHPPGAPRWEQVDLHDPARVSTALEQQPCIVCWSSSLSSWAKSRKAVRRSTSRAERLTSIARSQPNISRCLHRGP